MDPDEFRQHAHQVADWMADYFRDVGMMPVTPGVQPGDILRQVASGPPEQGEPFQRLFQQFREIIMPGMTHWNHPGWFAYFPANNSPPSVLAEMLTATLGAQCMSWATSPAATELEQAMMEWLRQMLALPPGFVGVIQDTASTATLVALLSARERATGHDAGLKGLAATRSRLTVYTSTEAHSSVDKGVKLAGYGVERLRRVAVDTSYAMRPDELERAIAADLEAGLTPACVVATVGTTSSTAVDPLAAIAEICRRHGVWLHVDAAYAGAAAIVPELRHLFDGAEHADSFVFNPHKWLLVNFDCSAYFVRDREALLRTFQVTPVYLRTDQDRDVVNFRDWGIQLGRRFRALKLWFVIRSYGVEGLRAMIRRHVELAQELAGWVEGDPDFELMAPVPFGLVCFRYRRDGVSDRQVDDLNRRLLARVNATRRVHLTHTQLGERYVIRMAIGQRETERHHVEEAWSLIRDAAKAVSSLRGI
ncbi:MAG TPA: aminotransferase class I/II-fold pyridoxal phosphate-dependent enzyme [Gemmatimonadales bacterium]|nr:aminotransferase class I/II-fold pyridoxal phosphate-dependent enzyme [Gemmatimonadales bacterium]